MNSFAQSVTSLWFLGILAWVVLGGFRFGKAWFTHLASAFLPDAPGDGLPFLMLAIPILGSASVTILCSLRHANPLSSLSPLLLPSEPTRGATAYNAGLSNLWRQRNGCFNFDRGAVFVLWLPATIYTLASIQRHWQEDGSTRDADQSILQIGNVFGMTAIILFAVVLIPVARHSSLLRLFGWDPAGAIRWHIWAGRIIVMAVLIHGGLHMYRWRAIAGESIWGMLIPPGPCWTVLSSSSSSSSRPYTPPTCVRQTTDCSCYHHFRNLTGFVAGLGLLVMALSSLYRVRRDYYTLFYRIHVWAGPLVLLATLAHWNKSICYLAGGLLYYMASSFCLMLEEQQKQRSCRCSCCCSSSSSSSKANSSVVCGACHVGANRLVSARLLPSTHTSASGVQVQRPCVVLTFEASPRAMELFRSGQYVKLLAPQLSTMSHPFTINAVPTQVTQLRIIARCRGNFTAQLARRVMELPDCPLYLDGFYGSPSQLQQALNHDVVVLVAGGIGITPYLTLLHSIQKYACLLSPTGDRLKLSAPVTLTKQVVLHWICRDINLIQYIRQEYFEPLHAQASSESLNIHITIHHTGYSTEEMQHVTSFSDLHENQQGPILSDASFRLTQETRDLSMSTGTVPFTPSRFIPVSNSSYMENIPLFLCFGVTAWLGLYISWYFYKNVQVSAEVTSRLYTPMAMLVLGATVAVLANIFTRQTNLSTEFSPLSQLDHTESHRAHSSSSLERCNGHESTVENGHLSSAAVTIQECHEGRPSIHQLVNAFDSNHAVLPGMFVCGPTPLMQEVRAVLRDRCDLRSRQCLPCEAAHIALYEESFEL